MSLRQYAYLGSAPEAFSRAILSGTVSHAYIIEGDHNTDKIGFAKAAAKALLCSEKPGEGCDRCLTCRKIESGSYEDLYMVEPDISKAGIRSVKDQSIEELQSRLMLVPTAGARNIAIVVGADGMTPRAQNRFLKTLEEPAEGTVIMLLSENVENLLPTIRSRCITLRLGGYQQRPSTDMDRFAGEILEMVGRKAFFHDMSKALDKQVKDRQGAEEFLDALEATMGKSMISGGTAFSRSAIAEGISLVEQARTDIRRNVDQKYAIKSLILKLEEY